jgi:AcrR family transcriptional regulator
MQADQGKARRHTLMDRILEVFFKEGISTQTMEGMSEKIGVSKRTLYKYFPNKDQLIKAAIMYRLEAVEAEMIALQASGKPYIERLLTFFAIVDRAIKPMAPRLMRDVLDKAPWIWPIVDQFRHDRLLTHLQDLLVEGQEQGFFRKDVDIGLILPIFIAIIEQIGNPYFFNSLQVAPRNIVETTSSIILGGILNDEGRAAFFGAGKDAKDHA